MPEVGSYRATTQDQHCIRAVAVADRPVSESARFDAAVFVALSAADFRALPSRHVSLAERSSERVTSLRREGMLVAHLGALHEGVRAVVAQRDSFASLAVKMGMNDDDEDGQEIVAVNLPQDLIPTVRPGERRVPIREDSELALDADVGGLVQAISPDDVPTERPPFTLPVESEERPVAGVEPLLAAKEVAKKH
jgi:hypothetical protein